MWESKDSLDIREQTALRVQSILSTHYPQNIDPAMDEKIRDHFPILLPREHMFAGSGRWQAGAYPGMVGSLTGEPVKGTVIDNGVFGNLPASDGI